MALKTASNSRFNAGTIYRNLRKAYIYSKEIERFGEKRKINIWYPLIQKLDRVFSYAHIKWDNERKELVYNIIEPKLGAIDKEIKETICHSIRKRAYGMDLSSFRYRSLVKQEISFLLKNIISEPRREILAYYIENEIFGLGRIEPLFKDPMVKSISYSGIEAPVQVEYGSMGVISTNLFLDKENIDEFVSIMAERHGPSNNTIEAYLEDGSSIQINLDNEMTLNGANFIINKASLVGLMRSDIGPKHLAYFWDALEKEKKMLVIGQRLSGKTSFLNIVSLFIHPKKKIISVESSPKISIPHKNWISIARPDRLDFIIKHRPDYLIADDIGPDALGEYLDIGIPIIISTSIANMDQLKASVDKKTLDKFDIIVEMSYKKNKRGVSSLFEAGAPIEIGSEKTSPALTSKEILLKEEIIKSMIHKEYDHQAILDCISNYYLS